VCAYCGTGILLSHRQARFCSSRCRVYHFRASQKLPIELTSRARWIRRRSDKVPLNVEGVVVDATSPASWSTYKVAAASDAGAGLGFVLNGDGLACIDLDHCLIDGAPTPAAQTLLERFPDAFVELSPSGDGLHVWGMAPSGKGSKKVIDGLHVEFYTRGRYMTITGKTFRAGTMTTNLEGLQHD
jgi:primase-polymerase (primpol)-like protein